MINDKRLGRKQIILPEITLEMIQLIAGSKKFHPIFFKKIFRVQKVKSTYYFDKILISTTPLDAEMCLEEEEIKRFKD